MSQMEILRLLYNNGTMNSRELLSKMDISKGTFYTQTKTLQRDNLIEVIFRERAYLSKKSYYLYNITNAGERYLHSIGLIKEVN